MESSEMAQKPFWKQPKSRRLEFKETFPKGAQIARTAVAFANGGGGKIIFGVRDNPRQVIGVPDNDIFPLQERIAESIFTRCAPNIVPELSILTVEDKNLVIVDIFRGSYKPYYIKKQGKHEGAYIRVGSANRRAGAEMLDELERQRRNVSFDSVPVYDLQWSDIDLADFVSAFKALTGKELDNIRMENLGLMLRERDRTLPSHAAILLSDSTARKKILPFAKVECARFKGTTMNVFLDQATIDLPVHQAPEACMAFIKRNIALSATIGEIYRQDRWEYPLDAIREAVINALVHRDYSQTGSDIKIAIYDDMLEITSPGPLPDTLAIEELQFGRSVIRNRILARIFKEMGFIEAWGSGIPKIQKIIETYQQVEVVFQEAGYAFQVQFIKQEVNEAVSDANRRQVGTKFELSAQQVSVLEMCRTQQPLLALIRHFKRSDRTKFKNAILSPLIVRKLLTMTEPDKPNSPKQKYRTTQAGLERLNKESEHHENH